MSTPTKWQGLTVYFEQAITALPELPPHRKYNPEILTETGATPQERARHVYKSYKADYVKYMEGCIDAYFHFVTKKEFPHDLRIPVIFWLRAELKTIQRFLLMIVARDGKEPKTILPFPDMDVVEVAKWLMVQWWMTTGLMDFSERISLGPDDLFPLEL